MSSRRACSVLGVLLAGAWAVPSADAAVVDRCRAESARTLAVGAKIRVFRDQRALTWGCVRVTGRRYRLRASSQAAVAAGYAVVTSYDWEKGYGDVTVTVEVHDVLRRRRVSSTFYFVCNCADRRAWDPSFPRLLVAATGVAAYAINDQAEHAWRVHRLRPGGVGRRDVLDDRPDVDPRSLRRVAGARLQWVSGGVTRVASLRR